MNATRDATGPKCPVCMKPTEPSFRPFCSRTCADVDLLRWMRGGYAIPGGRTDEDGETDPIEDTPQDVGGIASRPTRRNANTKDD